MLKLKSKRKKYQLFPKLNRLYNIYKKLLKEDQNFNWSFFKFIIETQWKNSYKINTIQKLSFIFLCKIDKWNKKVSIDYSYISKEALHSAALCQSMNIQLNEYKLLYGYNTIVISFEAPSFGQEEKRLMITFLDFQISNTDIMLNAIKDHRFDKIILIKRLENG